MKIVGYEAGRGEEGRERGGEREGGRRGKEGGYNTCLLVDYLPRKWPV